MTNLIVPASAESGKSVDGAVVMLDIVFFPKQEKRIARRASLLISLATHISCY